MSYLLSAKNARIYTEGGKSLDTAIYTGAQRKPSPGATDRPSREGLGLTTSNSEPNGTAGLTLGLTVGLAHRDQCAGTRPPESSSLYRSSRRTVLDFSRLRRGLRRCRTSNSRCIHQGRPELRGVRGKAVVGWVAKTKVKKGKGRGKGRDQAA